MDRSDAAHSLQLDLGPLITSIILLRLLNIISRRLPHIHQAHLQHIHQDLLRSLNSVVHLATKDRILNNHLTSKALLLHSDLLKISHQE